MLSQSSPVIPISQNSAWMGASFMSSLFGGDAIGRAPGSPGSYRYTIIPLPVVPDTTVTMERRADAIAATFAGRMEGAVDIYRLSVEADGWMSGILDTMAHGLLGLPLAFQGDPEMVSALLDADGTPGDFARMHPEAECAKIFRDGLGLGFGLGQYVLMCWHCDGVEWIRHRGATDAHLDVEECARCHALRQSRPLGARELFQLRWRDARWLWRNPVSLQWRYTGRQGQVDITPGDGEWFLFQTVPDVDIWRHGPWVWGTIAAIFARDSTYDRQNTSAVCAPTHVFKATGGTDPKTRADVEAQAAGLAFGNKIVLPGEWDHRIDAASADYVDVTAGIVDWSSGMWEVGITGNLHGMKAGTGFANMDVYARATRERRAFYATAWIRQLCAQGLVWWVRSNYGERPTPVGKYDVRSPEDKLSESKAIEAEGVALKSLRDGYDAVGFELEPAWVQERAQTKGVRVRPKASAGGVSLTDEQRSAVVLGSDGRAALGLVPFGDPRDQQTIAALLNAGKSGGAAPAGAPISPPPPAHLAAPAAPAARAHDDDDRDEDDEDAARLASEMSTHGIERCEHGKVNRCRLCGIERVRGVVPGESGAPHGWRLAWRAIPKTAPSPAQVAA